MKRVTGLGGFFIKTPDPKKLRGWYAEHLGIPFSEHFDGWAFEWQGKGERAEPGQTLFALFAADSKDFEPSKSPFMCNFRVADLDALLQQLAKEGVRIEPERQDGEYGKFAWIYDPDGNKIELWEPPAGERG